MPTCQECILLDKQNRVCGRGKHRVDPEEDYCTQLVTEQDIVQCNICHSSILILDAKIDMTSNNIKIYCPRCYAALGTCQTCRLGQACSFEADPDPMPKVIVQQVRQGNMVMQTQVKNPERIKKFCIHCTCWREDEEGGYCMKEYGMGCDKIDDFSL